MQKNITKSYWKSQIWRHKTECYKHQEKKKTEWLLKYKHVVRRIF